MRKNFYRPFAILITLVMAFSANVISTFAEDSLLSNDVVTCAEEMRTEYHEAIDKYNEEFNQEYLSNSYEANITYNKILNSIESNDNELRSHFSGAYINDKGFLVIALCCDTGKCRKEIEKNLSESDVIFEDGIGSYYYGQKELEAVNKKIASLQESIKNGEAVSANARNLMKSMPRTVYNEKDNTTSVVFNVSEEVEEAVLKNDNLINNANIQISQAKLSDSEMKAVEQYNSLIGAFRETVSCSEGISYTVCTGYEQWED